MRIHPCQPSLPTFHNHRYAHAIAVDNLGAERRIGTVSQADNAHHFFALRHAKGLITNSAFGQRGGADGFCRFNGFRHRINVNPGIKAVVAHDVRNNGDAEIIGS